MGATTSSQATPEVWPPDWEEMPEKDRKLARDAILSLSAMAPDDFMKIGSEKHVIASDAWKFEEYHAAAAAAVQEDIGLNKIIYKLVPRKCSESEFWRLYFSEVAKNGHLPLNALLISLHVRSHLAFHPFSLTRTPPPRLCLCSSSRCYSCSSPSESTDVTRRHHRRRPPRPRKQARKPLRPTSPTK